MKAFNSRVWHSHKHYSKNSLKWEGTLATYEFCPPKTLVDYYLFRIDQGKFVKDTKVLTSEECITQNKLLVCDFKIRKVKDSGMQEKDMETT